MKKLIGIMTCAILACLCISVFAGCGMERIHDHALVKHEAIAVTCEADGRIEYYSCAECGKYYEDAEAQKEIEKDGWIIPALGHNYGDLGICANCGDELTNAELVAMGYIAKVGNVYYKSLDAAFEAAGNGTVMLITHMDIAEPSDISGYAYGVLVESGILNGNGKNLEMTFGDSDKFSGLWILGETLGVKRFVIISDTKTAVYAEDMAHEVVLENLGILAEGSGFHIERCAKVILQNNHVVSSNKAGYKAAVFAGDGAHVVIESGHYEAETAILMGGYNGASIEINGGTFIGEITVNGADSLVINGGTFSVDPTEWIAEGLKAVQNNDGTWSVLTVAEVANAEEFFAAIEEKRDISVKGRIVIEESSEYYGFAYGAMVGNSTIAGNGNFLEMTFGDNNKFTGLWVYENSKGISRLVIVSDTKNAIYVSDIAHEFVLSNLGIMAEGSGIHAERCANIVLRDNHIVSSNIAGYKAAVFAGDGAQVLIESGHYEAEHAILTGGYNGARVEILGGNFVGAITVNGADTLVIKGGTFSVDPSKWVPAGYIALYDSEIQAWVVEECAEVSTLAEFTNALKAGGNIRLNADIELTKQITISKEVLIDLNGYDLTNTISSAYTVLFAIRDHVVIASSVAGSEIALGSARLAQVVDNYDNSLTLANVAISRTATASGSNTETILSYGEVNILSCDIQAQNTAFIKSYGFVTIDDSTITLPGSTSSSSIAFHVTGGIALTGGTVINQTSKLGTYLINGSDAIIIDDVTINITESFRTNAGCIISRDQGTVLKIDGLVLNVSLDETYGSKFINTLEGTATIQLDNITYNVVGLTSGDYYVPNENGTWKKA